MKLARSSRGKASRAGQETRGRGRRSGAMLGGRTQLLAVSDVQRGVEPATGERKVCGISGEFPIA